MLPLNGPLVQLRNKMTPTLASSRLRWPRRTHTIKWNTPVSFPPLASNHLTNNVAKVTTPPIGMAVANVVLAGARCALVGEVADSLRGAGKELRRD